jgi:hypothetical protein
MMMNGDDEGDGGHNDKKEVIVPSNSGNQTKTSQYRLS